MGLRVRVTGCIGIACAGLWHGVPPRTPLAEALQCAPRPNAPTCTLCFSIASSFSQSISRAFASKACITNCTCEVCGMGWVWGWGCGGEV